MENFEKSWKRSWKVMQFQKPKRVRTLLLATCKINVAKRKRMLWNSLFCLKVLVFVAFLMTNLCLLPLSKRKSLVKKASTGNRPNTTCSPAGEEEDKLFESGQFSASSSEALQRTRWWFLSLHFGFRARDESCKLCRGGVELQQDPVRDGREMLVWINERGTNTRKGLENGHQRAFQPKIYVTKTERCPIKFYKLLWDHRPEEMKQPDSP